MDAPPPAIIQHVTKASSDQLLRKFAQVGSESQGNKLLQLAKQRRSKRIRTTGAGEIDDQCESPSSSFRELLPPPVGAAAKRRTPAALIRRLGMGRSRLRARDFKNKSILGTVGKTWRRTVEGASKVFLDKHHNRHKRLINDTA